MSHIAHSITLGTTHLGQDATLNLPELLATRLLVQGNSGSGKSHLLRRLLEQTASLVQQVIIDPEGDFVTLAEKYHHLIIDTDTQTEASLRAAGERVRHHRASIVLNLEHSEPDAQLRSVGAFLTGMFEAPRAVWYPVLVVVDEAQLFAPVAGGETSEEARRASLTAMTNLMCRGRKRGMAGIIATQRLAKLAKNVAAEASNFLMGRTFLDIDMARAADLLGMERRAAEKFRDLARGQFIALGPALSRRPETIAIGAVETASHAGGPILVPLEQQELPTETLRDLILQPVSEHALMPRPKRELSPPADLIAQLDHYGAERQKEEEREKSLQEPKDPQELQNAIWQIITEITSDAETYYRPISTLYQDFQLRARLSGYQKNIITIAEFQHILGNIRAGLTQERALSEEWQEIEQRAAHLPEDIQHLYLLLARCAWDQEKCPDDAHLAKIYGTHSLSRACRQLKFLEKSEAIILIEENNTRRVAIIGPSWQTS